MKTCPQQSLRRRVQVRDLNMEAEPPQVVTARGGALCMRLPSLVRASPPPSQRSSEEDWAPVRQARPDTASGRAAGWCVPVM